MLMQIGRLELKRQKIRSATWKEQRTKDFKVALLPWGSTSVGTHTVSEKQEMWWYTGGARGDH